MQCYGRFKIILITDNYIIYCRWSNWQTNLKSEKSSFNLSKVDIDSVIGHFLLSVLMSLKVITLTQCYTIFGWTEAMPNSILQFTSWHCSN
jgi:hypothetical protein